jgi:hypothetical protein
VFWRHSTDDHGRVIYGDGIDGVISDQTRNLHRFLGRILLEKDLPNVFPPFPKLYYNFAQHLGTELPILFLSYYLQNISMIPVETVP